MSDDKALMERKTTIQSIFESKQTKKALKAALPSVGITADRMVRVMFSAFAANPKLMLCEPKTLLDKMIQCASLGLEPNTALGHAYLIPFDKSVNVNGKWKKIPQCQLIIGYKGYLSLCRRSGELSQVMSHVVYDGDLFEYQLGTDPFIKHIPESNPDGERAPTHVYAVAILKDDSKPFEVMTIPEIEAIRKRSKAGDKGPWVTDWGQMARKTVIRRLMNYLPLSIEQAQAVELDGRNEVGEDGFSDLLDMGDAVSTERENTQDALENMASKQQPEKTETPRESEPKKEKTAAEMLAESSK